MAMKRCLSFRNSSLASYIYGQCSRPYTSSNLSIASTKPFYCWHQRHYSGQQTPVESRRQEYQLNRKHAHAAISHLKSNDFSAARKIIADLKATNEPIGEQQCDEWLCKICHLLIVAENTSEFDWFVENIIFARNYASEKALMMILSHQLDVHNDLEKATEYFIRIVKQFKQTPWTHLLLTKLIRQDDDINIGRVIKAIESLRSTNLAHCLLAHAYTDCGHIDKASQIYSELPKFCFEQIKVLSQTAQRQWKITFLRNFVKSAKSCMDEKSRTILYEMLIVMHSDEHNVDQLKEVCNEMLSEKLKPKDGMVTTIKRLAAHNIAVPIEWLVEYSYGAKYQLHTLLEQQKLAEANALYLSHGSDYIFGNRLSTYLLSKNAENGNIKFFQQMRSVLGWHFAEEKHGLAFTEFECKAYLKADEFFAYMGCVRRDFKRCFDSKMNDTPERIDLPVAVMDMMEMKPIYNQLAALAQDASAVSYIKLPCILWCYDFINDSLPQTTDKYNLFRSDRIDVAMNSIVNILVQRQRIDKLEDFLKIDKLNKSVVARDILGRAYSRLFDGLYKVGKYDRILEHLEKAAPFIDEEHFDQNTLSKLKLGNDDFNGKFRSILWRFYIR